MVELRGGSRAASEEEALDAGEGAVQRGGGGGVGATRSHALWEKATTAGESRWDSALRSTSMRGGGGIWGAMDGDGGAVCPRVGEEGQGHSSVTLSPRCKTFLSSEFSAANRHQPNSFYCNSK